MGHPTVVWTPLESLTFSTTTRVLCNLEDFLLVGISSCPKAQSDVPREDSSPPLLALFYAICPASFSPVTFIWPVLVPSFISFLLSHSLLSIYQQFWWVLSIFPLLCLFPVSSPLFSSSPVLSLNPPALLHSGWSDNQKFLDRTRTGSPVLGPLYQEFWGVCSHFLRF